MNLPHSSNFSDYEFNLNDKFLLNIDRGFIRSTFPFRRSLHETIYGSLSGRCYNDWRTNCKVSVFYFAIVFVCDENNKLLLAELWKARTKLIRLVQQYSVNSAGRRIQFSIHLNIKIQFNLMFFHHLENILRR